MKILTVDIGTGTQDVYLFDSQLDIENGYKLILPSPTLQVRWRIQRATQRRQPILIEGGMMGGGPCAWAVEDHLRAGLTVYATPPAAQTLDDDLERVQKLGVHLVSEDESRRLPAEVERIRFQDFDFPSIASIFHRFGVSLDDLAAVAVAVFDHGAAPPGVSDRRFRFEYLQRRLSECNRLSALAYLAEEIPPFLTRLRAVAQSAIGLDCPLVVMDTAPAAVLGAMFDPRVVAQERMLIANIGNFHTLAFRLGPGGIEGLFEHHTGEITAPRLVALLRRLAQGTLTNEEVYEDKGHGALVYDPRPLPLPRPGDFDVVVTGPRRRLLSETDGLRPYLAAPFGDMMIAGCFGLLAAIAELLPALAEPIWRALRGFVSHRAPWDS